MKFCRICKKEKLLEAFTIRKNNKDGRDSYCKECNKNKSKTWNLNNKEARRSINKKYADNNKDKVLGDMRKWYWKNREYCIKKVSERIRIREKEDINFKIARRLRSRLASILRHRLKKGSAIEDLGCSVEYLKKYLESKFQPGMTWDNYGDWYIDHIIPLASFVLTDEAQIKKACNYKNLQPLWKQQNLEKRFIDGQIKKKN